MYNWLDDWISVNMLFQAAAPHVFIYAFVTMRFSIISSSSQAYLKVLKCLVLGVSLAEAITK